MGFEARAGRGFDFRDAVYAGLRLVALATGLAYALAAAEPAQRPALGWGFGAFAAYSLALYAAGSALFARGRKAGFYAVAAALDLGFTVWLMAETGGASSPFHRALLVWVAMPAFYFGLRAGQLASVAALAVYAGFRGLDGFFADPWLSAVQAGGVLMHGPLIGFLSDRERSRSAQLERANRQLAEANARLSEEQAKVVQAEKLSSIGLLAAGVAHEINNPLSGVMGCMRTLRDGSLAPERRAEYFEAVSEGLDRIRHTVQGLLDYARQRPPHPSRQDASELVAACLRLLRPLERKKDLRLENAIPQGSLAIHADRTQLMQALVNVLMNSIHAVEKGGAIAVSGGREGGRVRLTVSDDGPGIAPENLRRVCDPFFTTKPPGEGTGLGLAITLGIARAHGGDLTIESTPGAGTRVTLWLPESPSEASANA